MNKMFYYKWIILFYTVFLYRGIQCRFCERNFDIEKCAFDVLCRNNVDDLGKSYFHKNNHRHLNQFDEYEYDDKVETSECNTYIHINNVYNNNDYFPVHLKFIEPAYDTDELLIRLRPDFNPLVTHIDLSGNQYRFNPGIPPMDNLIHLNLSGNFLTVADMSNKIDISSLTEIDLSHNIIKDIDIEHEYNVYKGLKKIDLSFNYLTNISDASFNSYGELETLDMSHNHIEIIGPITFEGVRHMIHLNLSHNRIHDINSSLFRFSELKTLNLSQNNIHEVKTADFDKLLKLEILDLNSNIITSIDPSAFINMHLLINLNLDNNQLTNFENQTFVSTKLLKIVNLSNNKFSKLRTHLFEEKCIEFFSVKNNVLQGSLIQGTFEGLGGVKRLDLSNQDLESIEDYAFEGLSNVHELVLRNNNISVIAGQAFMGCSILTRLDLSHNKIKNIGFQSSNLSHLFYLSLSHNELSIINETMFHSLNALSDLDLSNNEISELSPNSFDMLHNLIRFQISNNPLNGTLQRKTFDGLSSLPSLDISCTLLVTIQNASFSGMAHLQNLNMSHSKIKYLEYNIFAQTGNIEVLDLSNNNIREFNINSTELRNVWKLLLNNNLIINIDSTITNHMLSLSQLVLSHNNIKELDSNAIAKLHYLQSLNVSYNPSLNWTLDLVNATINVDRIDLSGIQWNASFDIGKNALHDDTTRYLTISSANIEDVPALKLCNLRHLDELVLSVNKITKLNIGSFDNITTLRYLDLSHNKINYIQPGVFADNVMLLTLNLSQNFLNTLPYGLFQGLKYLSKLDISYNYIDDLQKERFDEVESLNVLIADHNKITTVAAEDFLGSRLHVLSIGGNPIPCDILVNLKHNRVPFNITATILYENNEENVNGVTCNKKLSNIDKIITNTSLADSSGSVRLLENIRDIMLEMYKSKQNNGDATSMDGKYLLNITNEIHSFNDDFREKIVNFMDYNTQFRELIANSTKTTNEATNNLLGRILRVLTLNSATKSPVQVTKDNATYENLLLFVNKIKQDLGDTMKLDKEDILNEVNAKIAALKLDKESILGEFDSKISALNSSAAQNMVVSASEPRHDKLSGSPESKLIFTETCVALILVILVGFVLFKIYKAGVLVRRRLSISTRELPGSMDSPL